MKVRIALLVGSNGKYSVGETYPDGTIDWGIMADNIMDWGEPGSKEEPKDPEATARYMVEVEVPEPTVATVIGTATAAQ